ncbi:Hypothetical protein SMAX5B_017301 [Scophthalmus maximus]|uniref:Uncharacterized protein n=1 Tax=Scophthalmus maximus TaxID=52904 RepID=A0A2U9CQ95_SCOMX|nr:Hypothetical protein SMAX5B_017301 [Scophthalmus maximus]
MARYRESGVPRPERWMALVGAGCAHDSPSLPLPPSPSLSPVRVTRWDTRSDGDWRRQHPGRRNAVKERPHGNNSAAQSTSI